ncbi:hypothetical protein ALC62_08485 [Cyphomyrmex costatus]|uniref:Uncharacterized protein n=1 Tax=Cyphomyrmex costatus TaxID=456900 RepID=A0A195CK28_9HYME|nr:hypothetical protein ALC62_08485 [Cyphomyrmex costatus]
MTVAATLKRKETETTPVVASDLCTSILAGKGRRRSFSSCRESENKGQNLAIYLSLSVSPAALWASLDIRENVRTGVRGNPAATQGVDRNDDDDDKLPAGKALRSTAGVEKARKGGRREGQRGTETG